MLHVKCNYQSDPLQRRPEQTGERICVWTKHCLENRGHANNPHAKATDEIDWDGQGCESDKTSQPIFDSKRLH